MPVENPSILDKKADPAAFRLAFREWLQKNIPTPEEVQKLELGPMADVVELQRDWLKRLDTIGLAAPHWPKSWGGEDLPLSHLIIINEELARADAPDQQLFAVSLNHVPATLYDWGTPEQIEKYIPGVRQGTLWCQGFSEPNAGSDLASLRTRAERKGDRYIVNGQKIWSSVAHHAEFCLLLARTDSDAPKHKGISYFILDMKTPGLDVRPIRQINGHAEFCEIFLDNVEIPAENLIGEENNGWLIAQSTLSAERGILIFQELERLQRFTDDMLLKQREEKTWIADSDLRREYMQFYAQIQGVRAMIREMLEDAETSGKLNDNAPYIKVLYSETRQQLADLILRIHGIESQYQTPSGLTANKFHADKPMFDFVGTWGWTIAGGTNQVLRNVIAERLIGLPREPRPA